VADNQPSTNGKRKLSHAANSGAHPLADRGNDLYETPPEATRALLAVERLPHALWEPAAGRGAIVTVLRDAGHAVIASDIEHYGFPLHFQRDFLSTTAAPAGVEAVVTNPPYKDAQQFVEHALKHVPRVHMLLRLAFLESERRRDILDRGQLARVHIFRNRLPMMHRDGWTGPRASSAIAFGWFVWERNYNGPALINRISWTLGEYDADDDIRKSVEVGFAAIRERVAAGGPTWKHIATEKENAMAEEVRPKLVAVPTDPEAEKQSIPQIDPNNPFANLDLLRNPQGYEEFFGAEPTASFAVRTLKEDLFLRVNPDPAYSLWEQYTVQTRHGTYFVFPHFRDALGALPRRCNLHVAVDGHGEYFLLLVKQANPGAGQEDNVWYNTARSVAAAATKDWVKITKYGRDRGWGFVHVQHKMFAPTWPTKSLNELLNAAFPERVIASLNHELIQQFKERGA
jgi:hypothetical protein